MKKKIRLGVLFGGQSCEHEVSVISARSMLEAIDRDKYDVTLIGIAKDGGWRVSRDAAALLAGGTVEGDDLIPVLLDYVDGHSLVVQPPGAPDGRTLRPPEASDAPIDVIFPLLHGPFGEDGTVQGLLELAGLPYVGSGVVGSAVGMDKEMMKRAFRAEGLPQLDYHCVRRSRWEREPQAVRAVAEQLGYPMFVKPANLGSSVGVHKIARPKDFDAAATEAATYDTKIIFEAAALDCREVECAVLGNEEPEVSVPGEIRPGNDFYDYAAKYLDDSSRLVIPAELTAATTERVRRLAIEAFQAVAAAGLARVDFFVRRADETIYVNEINTMPGFTPVSMYPKLWEASGIPYRELIDRLVSLALERHRQRARSRTSL